MAKEKSKPTLAGTLFHLFQGGNEAKKERSQKKEDSFNNVMDKFSHSVSEAWDDVCDKLEDDDGLLKWLSENLLRRLTIEAPVVVGFCILCVSLHILNITVLPGVSKFFGVDDYVSLKNPMQYIRLFSHILGHDGLEHLRGNMTHILLVGPSAEAFFGSKEVFQIILAVAASSALAHILIGKVHSTQLGASGVVFALILLNSLVSAKRGKIPISFLMTAILWIGEEFFKMINIFNTEDYVSHHAHLVGALVGMAAGYYIQQQKEQTGKNKVE
mmetsp:Transcript_14262/g.20878  ORF Transcript_14262/g.20878 Transcript_14262/m.20878 type:complete len:272 (+) Transcript_14262:118-933(+)